LRFEFPVDAAVRALKYRRRLEFLPVLAGAMHTALFPARTDCDVVVPVPLHFLRHARRGFNQAERLAVRIARRRRLPLFDAVERVRATPPQAGLTASERRRNLDSAFRVHGTLDGARVLLVDDVYTTGSTARELGRALVSAGAAEISVLVAARGGVQAAGAKV
jgi:ComF family protein